MNLKGRQLAERLIAHNLTVLNSGIRTSLCSNTIIDWIISNESPDTTETQSLSYIGSDHLPVLTCFHCLGGTKHRQLIPRIDWTLYSSILRVLHGQVQEELNEVTSETGKTFHWFMSFERFLSAVKSRVTERQKNSNSNTNALQFLYRVVSYSDTNVTCKIVFARQKAKKNDSG